MEHVAKALTGETTPCFETCTPVLQENIQMVKELREQLQKEWKMLQCSGK